VFVHTAVSLSMTGSSVVHQLTSWLFVGRPAASVPGT
jgi:hypothetical protein